MMKPHNGYVTPIPIVKPENEYKNSSVPPTKSLKIRRLLVMTLIIEFNIFTNGFCYEKIVLYDGHLKLVRFQKQTKRSNSVQNFLLFF